jgi:iron complex outermembrane receptor protein
MLALASVSLVSLALPQTAWAQSQTAAAPQAVGATDTDIVVQARRRDEGKQDVPLVVQAVTAQDLTKLNIKEFKDIQVLVPGLTLSQDSNGIAAQATIRGINYNVNASGNAGTIQFYMNDAPISAAILFQSMFDVGQIEVLRGPQGTLRGEAAPSGSVTVTTHRPDLSRPGASLTSSANTWGNFNLQAAINVPLITDKLAIRLAGVFDDNDDNQAHSLNNASHPNRNTRGGRVTVRFEPIDGLSLNGAYTQTQRDVTDFDQVESGNLTDATIPASPTTIRATDREAVLRVPRTYHQKFQVWNWSASYRFLGQKLDYVGSHNVQDYDTYAPNDLGAALPAALPASYLGAQQITFTRGRYTTHEVRLSSDERVAGIFDYVVGAFWNKGVSPSTLDVQTPVYINGANTPLALVHTAVIRTGGSSEKSIFGDVTAHIGQSNEISGGVRRISYHSTGGLSLGGVAVAAANEDRTLHATIFSASAKHNFSRDLMVYFNFGTSWRPGGSSNAIQTRSQPNITGTLASLLYPDAEKSKSYEVGFKSSFLDRKVRFNLDYFHQTFSNYQYAAPNIFYITSTNGVESVGTITTLAVGVPAKVDGVEGELSFRPNRHWSIDANAAYALAKITNGTVPCNPYTGVPTPAQIRAANNNAGQQVATCTVSGLRAGNSSPFVATVQGEYSLPVTARVDGYLRGLVTYYGKSLNDPTNAVDDVRAYALANLYAGIRSSDGGWEIGGYVKNLFDVERVLSRTATVLTSGASVIGGTAPVSTYRGITMTPPREIGVTARIAFGSR